MTAVRHPCIHLIEMSPTAHPNLAYLRFDLGTTALQYVIVANKMAYQFPNKTDDPGQIVPSSPLRFPSLEPLRYQCCHG